MRTRIKVCGIASADEARLAVEAGVDALGFNCVGPSSPRTVEDSTVAEITKLTPPPVATFLLTVEQTADAIADHVRRTHPTTV
jgi:phosphoribosylanthranilate isomerase